MGAGRGRVRNAAWPHALQQARPARGQRRQRRRRRRRQGGGPARGLPPNHPPRLQGGVRRVALEAGGLLHEAAAAAEARDAAGRRRGSRGARSRVVWRDRLVAAHLGRGDGGQPRPAAVQHGAAHALAAADASEGADPAVARVEGSQPRACHDTAAAARAPRVHFWDVAICRV